MFHCIQGDVQVYRHIFKTILDKSYEQVDKGGVIQLYIEVKQAHK